MKKKMIVLSICFIALFICGGLALQTQDISANATPTSAKTTWSEICPNEHTNCNNGCINTKTNGNTTCLNGHTNCDGSCTQEQHTANHDAHDRKQHRNHENGHH